jgi:hypothetical protein
VAVNTIHDRVNRAETGNLRHATWLGDEMATQAGLDIQSPVFANDLWNAAQQGYSLDPAMGLRKFGPHHVVLKTSLSNIRITRFFAGESEVKIVDPSRISLVEAVGCQVEFIRPTQIVRIPPTAEQLDCDGAQMRIASSTVCKRYISEMDLLRLQKALLLARRSRVAEAGGHDRRAALLRARVFTRPILESATQNHVDSCNNEIELTARNLTHPLCKLLLVERDNKRNVGDGVLWKTGYACGQDEISWRVTPLEITCERDTHNGPDATGIHGVALNDQHGTPIARSGPYRLHQIGPPDLTLRYHQSVRLNTRRAASARNTSGSCTPTSATTRFMRSVTRSGAWWPTNSVSARQ